MSNDIETYIFDLSRELNIENTHGVFGNELELIALVRNCPFIYDKSRSDFRDLNKKEAAWNAISATLHASVNDCKARWKSLREQYAKILKAISTDEANGPRYAQWEFMEDMKFLDTHIKQRGIKTRFRRKDVSVDLSNMEDNDEYRIEWLDDGKNYDSRELKLISLVKSCPLLYNKNSFDHKDPYKKDQAWLSIARVLGMTALDCKTRWKTLRERYARERKWQTEDPTRKPWEYYEDLAFLDTHVKPRRNQKWLSESFRSSFRPILPKPDYTAYVKSGDSNLVTNSGLPDNSLTTFQVQKMEFIDPSYQNCTSVESSDPITMSPNSVVSIHDNSRLDKNDMNTSQDEDDLFGQSIAAELKRITGRRKKMRLKASIFKLLWEAESDEN